MAEAWKLKGAYVEACNCDAACQCLWLEAPNDDVCTVSLAWDIHEGQYGDVDLSGLSVGLLISTEDGVMFDPDTGWDLAFLIGALLVATGPTISGNGLQPPLSVAVVGHCRRENRATAHRSVTPCF